VRPPLHLVTAPGETSNGGVACRTWPLCFLIIRRCGWRPVLALTEHVGEGERGRNREKKYKNFSSPVACPGEEEGET